jgi:hypothetical protein
MGYLLLGKTQLTIKMENNNTVRHVVNISSCSITEVEQRQERSVFEWVTAVKSWFNLPFTN